MNENNIAPGGCQRPMFDSDPSDEWMSLLAPPIIIQFKKTHPDAKLPQRNHDTDTGYDIFAVEDKVIPCYVSEHMSVKRIGYDEVNSEEHELTPGSAEVDTGLQVAHIQPGYWFQISPRSGLGFSYGIQPHLGVIDQTYRGHLGVKLYNFSNKNYAVTKGDKIAQIIIHKLIDASISRRDNVEETKRGSKGFGSSGK